MEELRTNDYLKGIVSNLPESPGIYQYLNTEGTIIYVGKAKNLKRRVSSYFNREHEPGKTRVLVSKIADIRYIVVNTEEDALLLENNLIKKYKPRYNVLLKDDKTYPSICVQNEYFPRVFRTRKIIRNGSSYYGPYSHIPSMYALLDLIKHLYPLRTCHLNLSPENIRAGKFNVCLEYHIKNCAGPCIGKQSQEEYLKNIAEIKEILKGNTQEIERMLFQQMQELAAEMKFEEAQKIKKKYLLLENYRAKSEVVSNVLHNIDVFSIEEDSDEKSAFVNYLHITNGAINQAFTFEYKKRLNESKEELLSLGIIEMRERYKSLSREIIVPFELDMELKDVVFTIPQRGDKKKLLELSILNVKQYKADRLKQAEKLNPEQRTVRLLKEIQQELHLDRLPMQIECFDNSNIQGSDHVAGCVVFVKGKPSKKDYRKYNIKTVEGPDDYASMYEVLTNQFGNPSSQYPLGREAKQLVEGCRATVAGALGCRPENLHFTSCGTESDNWAISAAVWQGRHAGRHIITTAVEHSAVLEPCRWLQQQGYEVTYLAPDKTGQVTVQQVADALREDTVLVSMMLVNNELGNIYPIAEIARGLAVKNPQTLLHTDAVQGFLKVPCSAKTLGADFLTISAHKIGGPKGVGALYTAPELRNLRPLLPGGGQEGGLRSGTEATAQIAGFARAVELRQEHLDETLRHMADIKAYCRERLLSIPGVVPVGEGTAPHILAVSLVGYPSANIVTDLGAQGICISAGSACHRGKASHVVSALHLDKKTAAGVIRISFGPDTSRADIDGLYQALLNHKNQRFPML